MIALSTPLSLFSTAWNSSVLSVFFISKQKTESGVQVLIMRFSDNRLMNFIFIISAGGVTSAAELKGIIREALTEAEEEKKGKTIVISHTTQTTAKLLMRRMGVASTEDKRYTQKVPGDRNFEPFVWPLNQTEKQATPSALSHFKTELTKFSVKLGGEGEYHLFDTHKNDSLLNVECSRVGKISGGTDAVIAPFGTAADSVTNCACVIFELKKKLVKSAASSSAEGDDQVTEAVAAGVAAGISGHPF